MALWFLSADLVCMFELGGDYIRVRRASMGYCELFMWNKVKLRRFWPAITNGTLAVLWTVILGWLAPQGMLVLSLDGRTWSLGPIRFVAVVPLLLGVLM
jgi:hypothetical protein